MDLVLLSRLQFAMTVFFHFVFVPLTLGLSVLLAVMETMYVRTGNEEYKRMVKFFGKLFLIKAPGVSDKNRYVKEVRLNGKTYNKLYITHSDIMAGGTLEFVMSSKPNKKRCITTGKPYSLSDTL